MRKFYQKWYFKIISDNLFKLIKIIIIREFKLFLIANNLHWSFCVVVTDKKPKESSYGAVETENKTNEVIFDDSQFHSARLGKMLNIYKNIVLHVNISVVCFN